MNILTLVKALFQAKAVAGELKPVPKSGFVSSEFWGAVFTDALLIAGVVTHFVSPNIAAIIGASLSGAYMVVRLILKIKHVDLAKVEGLDDLTEDQILALVQNLGKQSSPALIPPAKAG